MIAVNEAAAKAVEFARAVLDNTRASQLRLEEVEVATVDGSDLWVITLSRPQINAFEFPSQRREYKTFTVDGQSGKVLSMKIREVAGAG